jgi:hypothetical protein
MISGAINSKRTTANEQTNLFQNNYVHVYILLGKYGGRTQLLRESNNNLLSALIYSEGVGIFHKFEICFLQNKRGM